ncbi:oxysterol-binding protein-related protein 3-like, partial [Salmo trutta]|uniref:oxysterol-binding protein-related protein 3-like n=1 Tax=Salmo trutta TaxID=8032 RepID=UPI001131D3B2
MYPQEKAYYYPRFPPPGSPGVADRTRPVSLARQASVHAAGSFPVTCTSQSKVAAWLQSSDDMNKCSEDMSVCESYLLELNHLLQSMEVIHRTYSAPAINALLQASTFDTPKKEKRPQGNGVVLKTTVPSCISSGSVRLHASNPNLSTAALGTAKSYPEPPYMDSPIDVAKLQEDFCRVANN